MQKILELLIVPFIVNLATSALFAWMEARWRPDHTSSTRATATSPSNAAALDTVGRRLGVANRPMFLGESVLVTMTQGLMLWLAWWFPPAVLSFRTPMYFDMARGVGPFLPHWRLNESVGSSALILGFSLASLILLRFLLSRPSGWIAQRVWPQNLAWQGRATRVFETYAIALVSAAIAIANVWAFTALSVPNAFRVVIGGLVAAVIFIGSRART